MTSAPPELRAGPLVYTPAALRRLFFWLLTGDLVFTLLDQIEWKILPVVLKRHAASDTQIAIIIGSITAVTACVVSPIVSYRSDRHRGPAGRRRPYLRWAAPLTAVFLAALPFAPDLAEALRTVPALRAWPGLGTWTPVLLVFAALSVGYRGAHAALSPMFFCLFRDVVPPTHLGRFLALFRIVGALGTFAVTYWLLGWSESHPKLVFGGVAALGWAGFWAMGRRVNEAEAVPAPDKLDAGDARFGPLRAAANFVAESFAQPIYGWTYFTRVFVYAASSVSGFMIFFPQRELGLTLDAAGKLLSWPAIAWLALAYPVGRAVDRWGAIRVLRAALALTVAAYVASFFLVVGARTFFASAFVTGVAFWAIMMTQIALAQEIFHRDRYGQLCSANVLVQSLAIGFVLSPAAGWALDALRGYTATLDVPLVGAVAVGPYRCLNLILALFYGLAWFGLAQVRRHWRRHGGPDAYGAPL